VGVGFGVFWFLWASVWCACQALWVWFFFFFFFPLGFWLVIPLYMSCIRRGAYAFQLNFYYLSKKKVLLKDPKERKRPKKKINERDGWGVEIHLRRSRGGSKTHFGWGAG
jgi:hypothetical protein